MADEIDRDQEFNEKQLEALITRARLKFVSFASASHCKLCGELIPEKRRQAISGVSLCVECQVITEGSRKIR
ncbi:TraR/DksA family transcriptional regulator [Citrobacter sp. S2-9]|uniref:TraR/DksA family transcriptional regulator n=1 Tax=Citrobacter enshiensis TaxID=2971264 RepID=A0ABT8PV87_9ENTR|nr:TraR/DksA family transcriptional regulator [Citrobacter enshiensis]MDN8600281.1 TraR/DksA family transcriptional regulator [Citrobacter enshiensis]